MPPRAWVSLLLLVACAGAPPEAAAVPSPVPGPSFPQARQAMKEARAAGEPVAYRAALARVYELSGSVRILFELARLEAHLGDRAASLAHLGEAARAGAGNRVEDDAAFESLRADAAFREVADRFRANRAPVSHARVFAKLPAEELVTEDIVYDERARRFLVSSVRKGTILEVDAQGSVRELVPEGTPGAASMMGLGLRGDVLYATTADLPPFLHHVPDAPKGTAILTFDLATGKLRGSVGLPNDGKAHALTDLLVSPRGAFVSDSLGGDVYALDEAGAGATLRALVPAGEFVSPQTPALDADGKRLFVPDFVRGIAVVDLRTKAVSWLDRAPEVTLTGIDGLYAYGDGFVAVQNGIEPPRVVRFVLDRASWRITGAVVLERETPGFGEPTHGVIVGKEIFFLANAGWTRFDDDGHRLSGAPEDGPAIWVVRLGA